MVANRPALGLLRWRRCLVPTWRGWLVILGAAAMLAVGAVRQAYPFLALEDSKPGDALVVEGWVPDHALETAIMEFKHGSYDKLYVTGGPLDEGAPLSEYKTYAELGGAILLKLGFPPSALVVAPAPFVAQDRTFVSAVTLKRWWRAHGVHPARVNLLSLGPHARRSRLLFEKALGRDVGVGVRSCPPGNYDASHWWRSSSGFRNVTDEAIAYLYARFFFHEADDDQ